MGLYLLGIMSTSLVLTIILEVIGALILGIRNKRDLLLLCLVNLLTNPVVVLTYYIIKIYTYWNLILILIVLESMAIIVEGKYFKKYGDKITAPYLFAVLVNVFSYGMGKIISIVL